jgi:hypothetical protein
MIAAVAKQQAGLNKGGDATGAVAPRRPRSALLQRACGCGAAAGTIGKYDSCLGKGILPTRRRGAENPEAIPPIVHRVLRSTGAALDAATREALEPRFGYDFGKVRIHTDAQAAASAASVNAIAYTIGRSIVFGAGRYAPQTTWGHRLLAHELVHTLQQGANSEAPTQIGAADDPAEHEAERAGGDLAWQAAASVGPAGIAGVFGRGATFQLARAESRALQRQPDQDTDTNPPPGSAPAPAPPFQPPPPPQHTGPDVYICWSPTEAFPAANHSWFRVGGPEPQPDHQTFSLFPRLVKQAPDGTWCSQGKTFSGTNDLDLTRAGSCLKTPLNLGCIQSGFSDYPIGTYCPAGPNSNTFVGSIARGCNLPSDIVPPAVPGFDDSPPQPSSFGPDWTKMGLGGLLTCGPKDFGAAPPSAAIPEVNVEDLPPAPIPEVNVEDLPKAQ